MTTAANTLKKTSRPKAILFLVLSSVLWSSGGLFIKIISLNPLAIAGIRSTIAVLLMLIVLKRPKITWSAPQLGGAFACTITIISFVCATRLTTAANAIVLQYTAPIYVAIFSACFLKERTRLRDWITIFFVFCGMLLFFFDKLSTGGLGGNIIGIVSGIGFASQTILLRMQKGSSPIESVFLGNILTAIIGIPFMFQSMPDAKSWLVLLLLGVFAFGVPYFLYIEAIKHVSALETILVSVLEPVLNPLWVFLIVGEFPGLWAIIGGFVILVSVTLRCIAVTIRPEPSD